jgi:MFS family permease
MVLVVTNALRGVAVLPLLLAGTSLTAAYLVNFLVAAVTIFFVPAESATIPGIVRKRDLLVANSLFTFTFNGSFLLGFIILAPIAVSLYGFDFLWIVVALMFGIASLLCATLPPSPAPQKAAHLISAELAERAVAETRQGITEAFHYLRATPLVTWAMVYIALTYTLIAVAGALAPGFVREVLHLGERNVVVLVAPAGIGVVLGLAVLNVIGNRISRANAIGTGLLVVGLALLVLAAARPFADVFASRFGGVLGEVLPFFVGLVSITALFFGLAYAFITVPAMTLLQENLRDDIRGRVFGVLNVLVSIFSLLPLIFVGPIADVWGVAPVFVLGAIVVFVVWLSGRKVRLNSSLQ